jgi:glycosyltransferase involved in cell wall biosynthesis
LRCPALSDLPTPAPGRSGWPSTEESDRLPAAAAHPRITIVTPSFNQAAFLEETLRSVLLQGYPDLEYIVLDGGSTDGSVEIIRKYERWLHHWESAPDGGQSNAINRGLKLGSGTHATWINSDDMLCQNALTQHATHQGFDPAVIYVGTCRHIDVAGNTLQIHEGNVHTFEDLVRIREVWRSGGYIDQPAVLFPLALARSVGGLNPSNHRTMDYELWGRLFLAGGQFAYSQVPFGVFRNHPAQKTFDMLEQTRSLVETAAALIRTSGYFDATTQAGLLDDLDRYHAQFRQHYWRDSGRLGRLGLPIPVIALLRKLKELFLAPIATLWGTVR